MRTPIPLQARRELWAWRYAQRAFEHCRHCCEHIIREKMDDTHPLYYSLTLAAYVNYARPFKRSNGLKRLPELIVPNAMKGAHDEILAARDKIYAHIDADGFNPWAGKVDVEVRVGLQPGGYNLGCLEVTPQVVGLRIVSALATKLEEKCKYHCLKVLRRHRKSIPADRRDYSICVDAAGPDLVPVPPQPNHAP